MWSWNKDTEWGIASCVSLRFAVLVCYDDLLCWSVMIIGFFSCLWLFALLVFHDNSFLFVSYDYWLCLCFMIICFFFGFLWLFALLVFHDDLLSHRPFLPQPPLTFQSPKLITMEWIAGCLTLAILIHKHMVSGNESILEDFLIQLACFWLKFHISIQYEIWNHPLLFILLILNLPESFQNFFDGFGYFQTQD